MRKLILKIVTVAFLLLLLSGCGGVNSDTSASEGSNNPPNPSIILATTTSTQDSGLLDVLVPEFEKESGFQVKTIAVGTGQALAMGEKGEADVLLTHAPSSEKKLVDDNLVTNYELVMHNDFVIVGPVSDPAQIKGLKAAEALKSIQNNQSIFVSRGDESGTHKKEQSLWKQVDVEPAGTWYQESGSGMGQTLSIASEKEGYTMTDRATYLSLKKNLDLSILVEGEASLLNIYHVMMVNPDKYPRVNKDGAKAFIDFLIGSDVQKIIGEFGKEQFGESLFFPDAGKQEDEIGK